MSSRPNAINTAFWTYVIPMTATRAMRTGLILVSLFLVSLFILFATGFVSGDLAAMALHGLRHFLIMVGVPVGAVILSEIPIRDGITHRTLLYPLLGPVPRTTLAVVRLVTTALTLGVGSCVLLLLIQAVLRDGNPYFGRELLSVAIGSLAYVAIFSLIHLYNRRGLIAGLIIVFIFDVPIGRLPFTLRNISPSYHVGVIADQQESMQLPISFGMPDTSVTMSILVLLGLALVFGAATAIGFKRKNLGDIC